MGVIKLMDFIKSKCPSIIKNYPSLHYKNQTLAIDTPSAIYKFLIKTISTLLLIPASSSSKINIPMDSQGNQTGHLIGIMYRALLCIEVGIKPIWVFDGTPPTEKLTQLKRRKNLKEEAQTKSQEALDLGDLIQAARQNKRSVKISKQEIEDSIKMLKLMGMPTIKSYGQAEAQCAWLTKKDFADGVISEDLDTLAFGAKSLIREFSRDKPATEISREKLLEQIKLNQKEFIDFCILCGCDYTPKIPNIGPVNAYKLIQKEKSIEGVLEKITNDDKMRKKHEIPDDFNFLRARQLFEEPLVNEEVTKESLEQKEIDYEGLREFLRGKDFSENRVERWIHVAKEAREKQGLTK